MSAVATDVFEREPYRAPTAELVENNLDVEKDQLFSVKGRLGVLSFNARYFLSLIAMFACMVPFFGVVALAEGGTPSGLGIAIAAGSGLLMLVPIYVMIVSGVKRLHDLNHPGWMLLLNMIPVLGTLWTLYYMFWPSKAGDNNYAANTHATSSFEQVTGVIGIVAMVGLMLVAFIMPAAFS